MKRNFICTRKVYDTNFTSVKYVASSQSNKCDILTIQGNNNCIGVYLVKNTNTSNITVPKLTDVTSVSTISEDKYQNKMISFYTAVGHIKNAIKTCSNHISLEKMGDGKSYICVDTPTQGIGHVILFKQDNHNKTVNYIMIPVKDGKILMSSFNIFNTSKHQFIEQFNKCFNKQVDVLDVDVKDLIGLIVGHDLD